MPRANPIAENLEALMRAKGLNRTSLAIKAGLGKTAIRDIVERSGNPTQRTLYKLAAALDVPTWVLTEPDGPQLFADELIREVLDLRPDERAAAAAAFAAIKARRAS